MGASKRTGHGRAHVRQPIHTTAARASSSSGSSSAPPRLLTICLSLLALTHFSNHQGHSLVALAVAQDNPPQQQPIGMVQLIDPNNQTTSTDGNPIWADNYPPIMPSVIEGKKPQYGASPVFSPEQGEEEEEGETGPGQEGSVKEGAQDNNGGNWVHNREEVNDEEEENASYYYQGEHVQGPGSEVDDDIRKMVQDMSLRELAGQMTQIEIGQLITDGELDRGKVEYWIREWGVGSFLDTPSNHGGKFIGYSATEFGKIVDQIQDVALSIGRGIPIIYGLDSVHGANYVDGATLFPQQIALAATFNPSIAEDVGRITAKDTRAAGIAWVFAPILDVVFNKLWPRVYETFGEDPHVVSVFGRAIIHGLQGNYKQDRTRVAACMKHFIGYSASRDGKDKASAWIPENFLIDYFLPSFGAAVDVGVATAMETYIDVNGEPVVGSAFFLKELLRNWIEFRGMLVTDWAEGDRQFSEHKTVKSPRMAQFQMLKDTTIDMVMTPDTAMFPRDAAFFVHHDRIRRERLEESAARVLQLKKDLGLLDHPKGERWFRDSVGSQQDVEVALNGVRESLTLLKNADNVLPLRGSPRILLTGPSANSLRGLSGGWTIRWQGVENDDWFQNRGTTILKGMQRQFGASRVHYVPSVGFAGEPTGGRQPLLDAVDQADVAVVCLGESPYAEFGGNSDYMDLPKGQLEVIDAIRARSPSIKIILVLVEGRPRGLDGRVEQVDAVLMAYLPGPWGGGPIAEALAGVVNPSGRLPVTYPRNIGGVATNYYRSGVDAYDPLFSFSAGMSYSTVEYSSLQLSEYNLVLGTEDLKRRVDVEDLDMLPAAVEEENRKRSRSSSRIRARVQVRNTSNRPVKETVFWYVTQDYRPQVQPEKWMLKGFEKVSLDAGEVKTVEFEIRSKMFFYHNRDLHRQIATGVCTLTVNAMRPEAMSVKFAIV